MKNKIIFISLLILILSMISIGTICAEDVSNSNLDDNEFNKFKENENIQSSELNEIVNSEETKTDKKINKIEIKEEKTPKEETIKLKTEKIEKETLTTSNANSKTWDIYSDESNPNQILNPTVQPLIDQANPGDTIIFHGEFLHCQFEINKTLTLIADEDTLITPCPHHQWPDASGIHGTFHITPEASGTVLKNFIFSNKNFDIANDIYNPYAIFIDGASNIYLENININWTGTFSRGEDPENYIFDKPIMIKNANNINLVNSLINHTINGVSIENSSNINLEKNLISTSKNAGILIDDKSSKITINQNNISNSKTGINLSSADNVLITRNIIKNNNDAGIYVNSNITKLEILGNIFAYNGPHAVLYDYRVRNLNLDKNDDLKTNVDNNFFTGHSDMILHHRIFIESENGDYNYNPENDEYIRVEANTGKFDEDKGFSYMKNAYMKGELVCGHTYITTSIPWDFNAPTNGKYDLTLSLKINQTKKGVYSLSLVDNENNLVSDFDSFYALFLLNEYDENIKNQKGLNKLVQFKNGIATVSFIDLYNQYKTNDNKITAILLGISDSVNFSPKISLDINDSDIPTESDYITEINKNNNNDSKNNDDKNDENNVDNQISNVKENVKLISSKLITFPFSETYFKVKLTDNNGKILPNKKIIIKFNGNSYTVKTDKNGIAKVKINLRSKKTYKVNINFVEDNNYKSISKINYIIIKTGTKKSKILSSNMKVKKNTKKTYKIKLTSGNGKAIKKSVVIFKVNGKTYIVKTSNNGIAKFSIKFTKSKKYKIKIQFLGNRNFKATTSNRIITVSN